MEVERDEIEAALGVSSGGRNVDLHAAHRVDDPLEALEVDLEVVLDRDVEVLGERVDDLLGADVIGGVDLLLPHARDVDRKVTGKRDQIAGLLSQIDMDDQESALQLG